MSDLEIALWAFGTLFGLVGVAVIVDGIQRAGQWLASE